MKVLISLLLCCFLLTACGAQPDPTDATEPPVPSAPPETAAKVSFTIYTPNENVDGFDSAAAVIDALTAQNVVDALIGAGILNEGIQVNSDRLEGAQLHLDFNAAFRDQLVTYGTTGELMMMGSVVNTFLSAYGADTVMITVEGKIMESGHVIYDFPLAFYE